MSSLCSGRPNSSTLRTPSALRGLDFADRFIDRQVEDARHRRHFPPHAFAFADEQRQHQHVRRQPRLLHERPHRRRRAQPAQTLGELQGGVRLNWRHRVPASIALRCRATETPNEAGLRGPQLDVEQSCASSSSARLVASSVTRLSRVCVVRGQPAAARSVSRSPRPAPARCIAPA